MTTDEVYGSRPVKRSRPTRGELKTVDDAIVEAARVEHPVSLRGIYYRVVSAGAVPKTEAAYKQVSRELVKLRAAGTVPYSWITDGTRLLRKPRSYRDVEAMLDDVAASYRKMLWYDAPVEVIVLSEKDAISGTILPITAKYDVELGIVRGYSSVTFAYSVAETVKENTSIGKTTFIYQIGDHDPSGVDAWRSFQKKIREFAPNSAVGFERLAVTEEQIDTLKLPTRPTKSTDSRAAGFRGASVEVDAIAPTVLRGIVEKAISRHIEPEVFRLTKMVEAEERAGLVKLAAMIGGGQ